MHWNAVPWYVGDGTRNAGVGAGDVQAGLARLDRLMGLLPELRLVVTMGKPAERPTGSSCSDRAPGRSTGWRAAHPSPRVRNGHPQLWPGIEAAFARAAQVSVEEP